MNLLHARQIALLVVVLSSSTFASTTWYVNDDGSPANGCTSWADACPELQKAMSLAMPGDQVWIAAGNFRPDYDVAMGVHTGSRTASFDLETDVAVYGGFEGTEITLAEREGLFNQTILTGDLADNDIPPQFPGGLSFSENSYHVVTAFDVFCVLDGFLIRGGNANSTAPHNVGACINIVGDAPTIRHCTRFRNAALGDSGGAGGGLARGGSLAETMTISDCASLIIEPQPVRAWSLATPRSKAAYSTLTRPCWTAAAWRATVH